MPPTAKDRQGDLWRKLVTEGLAYGKDINTNFSFGDMSKRYGRAWIEYLKAAWEARGDLSDNDFCLLNGGVPTSFLENNLKNDS